MYLALRYVNYTMNPVRTYLLYIPRDALPAEKFPKIKIQAITDEIWIRASGKSRVSMIKAVFINFSERKVVSYKKESRVKSYYRKVK